MVSGQGLSSLSSHGRRGRGALQGFLSGAPVPFTGFHRQMPSHGGPSVNIGIVASYNHLVNGKFQPIREKEITKRYPT